LHDRALWAEHEAHTPFERQAVVAAAAELLDGVGDRAGAEQLLVAEVDRSPEPYYYMETLADFAKERKDSAAALAWLKRAWDAAQGTATRTQWGIYYVRGLIELTPDDRAGIEATLNKMVGEIAADPGAYYQRTRRKLGDLAPVLQQWAGTHQGADVLTHVRARLAPVCGALPADSESRKSCENFGRA
jgi:protein disulfide-isomerase